MSTSGGGPTGTALGGAVLDGRYRVGARIATGGMSTVYRGTDLRLDRPVAIKVMAPSFAADPSFLTRFEREARLAAGLAHRGVVGVYDQGRDGDVVFLVMELVDGGSAARPDPGLGWRPVRRGDDVHPRVAVGGPERGPRGRPGSPGRHAGERADLVEGRGQGGRLRFGPSGDLVDHGDRERDPGHGGLSVARTGLDGCVRPPVRRVLDRHRRLRDVDRQSPVRRRQPDLGGVPARARGRSAGDRPGPRSAGGVGRPDPGGHPPRSAGPPAGCRRVPGRAGGDQGPVGSGQSGGSGAQVDDQRGSYDSPVWAADSSTDGATGRADRDERGLLPGSDHGTARRRLRRHRPPNGSSRCGGG